MSFMRNDEQTRHGFPSMGKRKHYDLDRDPVALGQHYINHVDAMTREKLHSKADIAAELAYRDQRIEELEGQRGALQHELTVRRQQQRQLCGDCGKHIWSPPSEDA